MIGTAHAAPGVYMSTKVLLYTKCMHAQDEVPVSLEQLHQEMSETSCPLQVSMTNWLGAWIQDGSAAKAERV